MGFFKQFFGQMGQISVMAKADMVSERIPGDADYVTIGPVIILEDAKTFNGGDAGFQYQKKIFGRGNGRDLGYVPPRFGKQEICYLVLSGNVVRVISTTAEVFSINADQITALDAHRESGFILFLKDGRGIAVGNQTPIEVPAGFQFNTIHGMTNGMYGWDAVLEKYGVKSNW